MARLLVIDCDCTPQEIVAVDCVEFFAASYRELWRFEWPPVHDLCTVVTLEARA